MTSTEWLLTIFLTGVMAVLVLRSQLPLVRDRTPTQRRHHWASNTV